MAHGNWEGKGLMDTEFRSLFNPEAILSSDWYKRTFGYKN